MSRRTAIAAAVVAVLLVPLLAVPASAHGEHKVAKYTLEVGFGTEPGYAGVTNSVQVTISNNGKPVTDAKGLKVAVSTGDAEPRQMALEPYFGDDFGGRDAVAFFVDQSETSLQVDPPRGGERVVGPQHQPAVARRAGERDRAVDQLPSQPQAATLGRDQQDTQLGGLVVGGISRAHAEHAAG